MMDVGSYFLSSNYEARERVVVELLQLVNADGMPFTTTKLGCLVACWFTQYDSSPLVPYLGQKCLITDGRM